MNFIQTMIQAVEVGRGQILVRIIPLVIAVFAVGFFYNFGPFQTPVISLGGIYHGLSDAQSMDNAQLARQILRGQGFTTKFLRPQAVGQLRDYAISQSLETGKSRDLFPPDQFPPGAPRILPDTYNAPGYPYLLAAWFRLIHPEFDQTMESMYKSHLYSPDRWIPLLNQIFMLLTAILVFALGHRLFDNRVAWMSLVAFLGTDLVWHYTLTALSTSVLMFLVTAMLMCALEIFCVAEACFANEDRSFVPAWLWGFAVALLLAAACLTRLHLLILLVPLFALLILMPQASFLLFTAIALVVVGLVTPWLLHVYTVSGNPLGSNAPLLLYGQGDYTGNQIYCTTSIPSYEQLLRGSLKKEITGFRWYFEHAWSLLGSNPLILLYAASLLHRFKRNRTQVFNWLLFGCALALITANNLGSATPDAIGPWNILVVLFPCMLVIGSAFFFILLDRLNVMVRLLNTLIVVATMALTVAPLIVTLTSPSSLYYSFPPYMPPLIKTYGQFAQPDEWVTTDMPWATAWYADRASLWLPDSVSDFQNLHDNICPTGLILLTPVTWSGPISAFTTGEYKDWLPFIVALPPNCPIIPGLSPPPNFPLTVHTLTAPGGPDYSLWSDRPRWQTK